MAFAQIGDARPAARAIACRASCKVAAVVAPCAADTLCRYQQRRRGQRSACQRQFRRATRAIAASACRIQAAG